MRIDLQTAEQTFEQLSQMAKEKTYFFSEIWERSRDEFGPTWVQEIVDNVVRLFGAQQHEGGWEAAIKGYAEFALDAMRNQKYFETHRHYRWNTLEDIQGRYYENEDHMMKNYLPGMYLSHYLWPHHFKLLTFFRSEALPSLVPGPQIFYDVGIGTGLYSREVLRAYPEVHGKGFDISPFSARFTRNLLQAFDLDNRYEVILGNIFGTELPWETADFLVSQEVLEHLQDPGHFTQILYGLTKPGGRAYITAAINAGHSDHIYLFRSPEEVQSMLTGVGWEVLKERAEYAYTGMPLEITPCVAGFLCQR